MIAVKSQASAAAGSFFQLGIYFLIKKPFPYSFRYSFLNYRQVVFYDSQVELVCVVTL